MTEVVMQKLSDTMEEGTIVAWLVSDGGSVAPGDELAEIQTDKAIATLAAETAGVIHILLPSGSTAAVGETIARLE